MNEGEQRNVDIGAPVPLTEARATSILSLAFGGIGIVALFFYAWFLYARAVNIPFRDDILDVLNFLVRFEQSDSWAEKASIFFAQHNDHRTAASRVVYYLMYRLTGEANFRTLTFLVNLAIPALCVLYSRTMPDVRGKIFCMGTVALMLSHPRAYDAMFFPMAAFAFHFSVVYALASLLLLRRLSPPRFALAVLFAVGSTFSLSSGQLVWMIGAAYLVCAHDRSQRGFVVYLSLWALVAILTLVLFHWNFVNFNTPAVVISLAYATPLYHFQYFLSLLGALLSFGSTVVATGVGAGAMLLLVWLSIDGLRGDRAGLCFFAWFLVLGSASVALGRAPYSNLEYALTPRYCIASANFIITLLLLLDQKLTRPHNLARLPIFLFALVICTSNYAVYTREIDASLRTRLNEFNRGRFWVYGYPIAQTNGIVESAVRAGIYRPPERSVVLRKARQHTTSQDQR